MCEADCRPDSYTHTHGRSVGDSRAALTVAGGTPDSFLSPEKGTATLAPCLLIRIWTDIVYNNPQLEEIQDNINDESTFHILQAKQ